MTIKFIRTYDSEETPCGFLNTHFIYKIEINKRDSYPYGELISFYTVIATVIDKEDMLSFNISKPYVYEDDAEEEMRDILKFSGIYYENN